MKHDPLQKGSCKNSRALAGKMSSSMKVPLRAPVVVQLRGEVPHNAYTVLSEIYPSYVRPLCYITNLVLKYPHPNYFRSLQILSSRENFGEWPGLEFEARGSRS